MYLKKVIVDNSSIEGRGVFAGESIRKNEIVWKFVPEHDCVLSKEKYNSLSKIDKESLDRVAYLSKTSGMYVFPPKNDPANYTNHSSKDYNLGVIVNLDISSEPYFVANKDIDKGEELTNNYNEFDQAINLQPAKKEWLK